MGTSCLVLFIRVTFRKLKIKSNATPQAPDQSSKSRYIYPSSDSFPSVPSTLSGSGRTPPSSKGVPSCAPGRVSAILGTANPLVIMPGSVGEFSCSPGGYWFLLTSPRRTSVILLNISDTSYPACSKVSKGMLINTASSEACRVFTEREISRSFCCGNIVFSICGILCSLTCPFTPLFFLELKYKGYSKRPY